ncbi:MAG: hypothetical protein LQ352_006530 [Teloschistes flavicans]|nr:MAG: hypothetical protein LQ352_006530 [Teloschistes flavicans]
MDVSNLLVQEPPSTLRPHSASQGTQPTTQRAHQYPTRHSVSTNNDPLPDPSNGPPSDDGAYNGLGYSGQTGLESPISAPLPKNVAFELLFDGPNSRARLPMRVQIFPHDTTDSIIATVKNFYGLYDGAAMGVSFEDEQGNTLIARYENLRNNMVVYVRVIPEYTQSPFQHGRMAWHSGSPTSPSRGPHLDEAFQMPPPQLSQYNSYDQPISRPGSRVARKRSLSPRTGRNRRSVSAQKGFGWSGGRSRDTSLPRTTEEANNDGLNVYSDSDGGAGSVTSSRKARSEQLASAEISVDNIVQGGRRKRAKFESSELPLFVPPQVPASNSISSISPQRRSNGQDNPSPFAKPPQRAQVYAQPLQSPLSYGYSEYPHGIVTSSHGQYAVPMQPSHGHRLRERSNPPRLSYQGPGGVLSRPQASGILPTPDPTVASCISDEDVALQLMRLGDASNISHGRTSASTLDDTMSGRAEAASSVTSDSDDQSEDDHDVTPPLPAVKSEPGINTQINLSQRHNGLPIPGSGGEADGGYRYNQADDLVDGSEHQARAKSTTYRSADGAVHRSKNSAGMKKLSKPPKQRSGSSHSKIKVPPLSVGSKVPLSPTSLATQSRKASSASTLNFQHHLGADEEDLSSKPRCQRCRKSKKGCDRQRPCQRCKDAGIGADGCISEDEGNGRKGRFGRHMGVSVKKDILATPESETASAILTGMAAGLDKSKKRKR